MQLVCEEEDGAGSCSHTW